MALTEKLTNIADAIRAKTGSADKLTLDGMATAIADIETGGSGGGTSGIYMAKITPAEDVSTITINHNLGTTDLLLALVWAESLREFVPTTNQALGNIWLKTDIPTRVSNSVNRENLELHYFYNTSSSNINSVGLKNSTSYVRNPVENDTFTIKAGTSSAARFYGGVTYTVIVIAASAFAEV